MYFNKPESGNSIKLILNPTSPPSSEGWEVRQQESFLNANDGSTDENNIQKGSADNVSDMDADGLQLILQTTKSGRVKTRSTKLQEFKTQYQAASKVSNIFDSAFFDLDLEEFEMHEIAAIGTN